MSEDKRQAKIDLIAKLLAKAESTTPEEAEALTEHAERLMVKYMIDQATIAERRSKQGGHTEEKIVEEMMEFRGVYRDELLRMAALVANALGPVRCMSMGRGTRQYIWLVGFESDVAQAKLLISSLHIQSAVAVRAWWAEHKAEYSLQTPYDQEKARRSFVHGFGSGASARIRDSRQTIVKGAGTGTELVLLDRSAKVDEYYNAKNLRAARARTATGGGFAAVAGREAGLKANTGGREMTQGRAISS